MVEFKVHGFRFEMPPECACCLAPTNARQAFADGGDPTAPVTSEVPRFPWCERCQHHARLRQWMKVLDRVALFGGPVLIALAFVLSVMMRPPMWLFLVLSGLAIAVSYFVHRGAMKLWNRLEALPECTTGDAPVHVFREGDDGWRIVFHNGTFARQFVRLNMPEGPAIGSPQEGALFPQNESPGRGLLASEQGRKRTFLN